MHYILCQEEKCCANLASGHQNLKNDAGTAPSSDNTLDVFGEQH